MTNGAVMLRVVPITINIDQSGADKEAIKTYKIQEIRKPYFALSIYNR
jgi:hypothetical protein